MIVKVHRPLSTSVTQTVDVLDCFIAQDPDFKSSTDNDTRQTQSRDANDVTSGPDVMTSSTPEAEMTSSVKGAVRAKRKSSCVVWQSDTDTAAPGVVGCYGNRVMPSGVANDNKDEELKSAEVTSLNKLELAAAIGRSSNDKLDDVKARLTH